MLTSDDLLDPLGRSARALSMLCDSVIPSFPASMIELVVVHPLKARFEWTQIPRRVKELAEMSFHGCTEQDVYGIYGVLETVGSLVVVRPDGVVGIVEHLEAHEAIKAFFGGCLVAKSEM